MTTQRNDPLRGKAQCPGAFPGTPPPALGMQQRGQEQDGVLGYLQDSRVCNTHDAQNPL